MTNPTTPPADHFCVGDVWRSPRGVDWRVDKIENGLARLRALHNRHTTQWRGIRDTGTNTTNAWIRLQSGLPWKTDGPAVPESREPASVAADARPLSPAAQAVLDAANGASSYGSADCLNEAPQIAAAALRAVADQVVPDEITWASPSERVRHWPSAYERAGQQGMACVVRRKLILIAAELEGHHG